MMFNTDIKRLGFACKYMHEDQSQPKRLLEEIERPLNTRATTVAWLNRQSRDVAEERLWEIMLHNTESARRLVEYVGTLPENRRMVRLSSDLLPVYTEPTWSYFWHRMDVINAMVPRFAAIGELAQRTDVRLSFHPGQFCVLASDNPDIVDRSLEEFEYHADMARWMGFGRSFQDFKINVHIAGRQGPEGIKRVIPRLSTEARNTLTIENDEMSWGLGSSLELADHCALVLDIHHHWIRNGEYIEANDDRIKRVIDSWRGVRPVIHYSVSREDLLPDHCRNTRPDLDALLAQGYKKAKLRAHSDFYWNVPVNDWALTHWEWADIMCESKAKNLASQRLYEHAQQKV
jgi:UV DNA damage repair endonuclease